MKVTLDRAVALGRNVFELVLTDSEKRILLLGASLKGERSILAVRGKIDRTGEDGVAFELQDVIPLVQGGGSEALLIGETPPAQGNLQLQALSALEQSFLSEVRNALPALANAVQSLLIKLRESFPGDLWLSKNRVYVNSPSNFFTFRIQPRARNVRIDIYGLAPNFETLARGVLPVDMRRGRSSYSYFFFANPAQLPTVIAIIQKSYNLKHEQ